MRQVVLACVLAMRLAKAISPATGQIALELGRNCKPARIGSDFCSHQPRFARVCELTSHAYSESVSSVRVGAQWLNGGQASAIAQRLVQ